MPNVWDVTWTTDHMKKVHKQFHQVLLEGGRWSCCEVHQWYSPRWPYHQVRENMNCHVGVYSYRWKDSVSQLENFMEMKISQDRLGRWLCGRQAVWTRQDRGAGLTVIKNWTSQNSPWLQVRDEYRTDFDSGRGGYGKIVQQKLETPDGLLWNISSFRETLVHFVKFQSLCGT